MRTRIRFCFIAITCLALISVLAPSITANGREARVDALFSGAGPQAPGAAVIILKDGQMVYKQAYGTANLELGVPVALDTRFRLASVTKQFTAAAILQLHDRGLLDVDSPIAKYLPDFPNGDKITVYHLLTHTAGIPDFISYEEAKKVPQECAPGERMNYSNTGYVMLGLIIEKVSGKSYEAYLKENIFDPLGMKDSGYDHHETILKNRASGYLFDPGSRTYVNAPYQEMKGVSSAGALYSTIEDMARWDQALYGDRILKPASIERAFKPVTLTSGRQARYGCGWMISEVRGVREIGHGGDINGFNTYIARYPDQKFSVIVLSNVGMRPPGPLPTATDLARKIAEIYLDDVMKPAQPFSDIEVDPKILARYAGDYELHAPQVIIDNSGKVFKITLENGKLMGESIQGKAPLLAESPTVFAIPGSPVKITFEVNAGGEVTGLIFNLMDVREFKAVKIR